MWLAILKTLSHAIRGALAVDEKSMAYLEHYGYLSGNPLAGTFDLAGRIASAIRALQTAAGVEPTGMVDDQTKQIMRTPRCGCLDVQHLVSEEARWRKRDLTYGVEKYIQAMSTGDQDDLMEMAWKAWTDIADIRVKRIVTGSPDVLVTAGRGRADGFDGPGGTLAYAYLPNGTDQQLILRVDLDERFVRDTSQSQGIPYLNMFTHELGHILGLEHSRQSGALMAPFLNPAVATPQQSDDIPRIQALYGPSRTPGSPSSPAPKRKMTRMIVTGEFSIEE